MISSRSVILIWTRFEIKLEKVVIEEGIDDGEVQSKNNN